MLYHLFDYLQSVYGHFAGARLFTYISFRAILAGVVALLISIWFGNGFINFMKRHNISETQRDEKLDPFNVAKKGVPTMGGLIVIAAILVPCLLLGRLTNVYMILMLVTTLILPSSPRTSSSISHHLSSTHRVPGVCTILIQVTSLNLLPPHVKDAIPIL